MVTGFLHVCQNEGGGIVGETWKVCSNICINAEKICFTFIMQISKFYVICLACKNSFELNSMFHVLVLVNK